MATQAQFAITPHPSSVLINTANTDTTGTTGTFGDVIAAAATGTRVDAIQIKGITAEGATQAADSVRLWLFNGTTRFFFKEQIIPVGSGNVSTTVPNVEYNITLGIDLPTGWKVQASTHAGGSTASYHVSALAADY